VTAGDVFLAAFLGCLLALAVVGVAGWQIVNWKARRFVKNNAGDLASWLEGAADGDPETRAQLDQMVRRRAHKQTAAAPDAPRIMVDADCGECKQKTPSGSTLEEQYVAGWRIRHSDQALHCPACVQKHSRGRGISVCACGHEQEMPADVERRDSRAWLMANGWGIVNAELSCPICVAVAKECGGAVQQ
jgi:hypothetical protein